MSNNLSTSSISIVLNKIDIDEFDPKSLESLDQNSSLNEIEPQECQPLSQDNLNKVALDDLSDLDISKLNSNLQVKPLHWTEEYWEQITSKYKWFMHKDSFIGCKICYNIKSFMGKKSLLGTLKLYLMDLSYETLEIKLATHNSCAQHNKSINLYRAQLGKPEISHPIKYSTPVVNILRKSRPIGHYCTLCQKGYKIKKALAKHIYSCNNEHNHLTFDLPCKCEGVNIKSIRGMDEHNVQNHSSSLAYVCKFCSLEFKQTTVLFGHLLTYHDFYWNPYTEMPSIIEKTTIEFNNKTTITNRPERKKSLANSLSDNIYIMYGSKDNLSFNKAKEVATIKRQGRKRHFKEKTSSMNLETAPTSDIRIERVLNEANNQEISKLTISQNCILTCEYCGGRYLSMGILEAHMSNYHMVVPKKELDAEENRRQKFMMRLNKMVNKSNLSFQINKNAKMSTYIRLSSHMRKVRALQMKKKKLNLADKTSKINEELRKKIKQKDFNLLKAKRNKVSASVLKCPACQISFGTLDLRLKHISDHHPELQKFSCEICGLIFTNHKNYGQHLEKSHNNYLPKQTRNAPEQTYSCENCHLVFTNQADLSHHLSFSHPEIRKKDFSDIKNNQIVQNCDIDYVEPIKKDPVNELESLIVANCEENLSRCSNCEMVLNNQFELLIHSFTHNENGKQSEDLQICPHCSKVFFGKHCKVYLKDHYNCEHLKKPLPQCLTCKSSFSSSFVLEKHQINNVCQNVQIDDPYLSLMTDEKLAFSCSQCSLIFAGQNSKLRFDIHMEKCRLEWMESELLDS